MPVALPLAIVGSAAIGAVASSSASKKATKAATSAAESNNQLQRETYAKNQAALSPYARTGEGATSAIQALLGLSGQGQQAIDNQNAAFQNFRNSTGYQDQFNEGQRSVTGALGRSGMLDSGAAQKALVRYGQSQANSSFGNYYGALSGQQQIGLGAASALAGVGQNFANSVSVNNNNAANAAGNAALSNAANINNLLQSGLSAYGLSQGMGSSYGGKGGLSVAQPNPYGVYNTPGYGDGIY